MSKIVIIGGGYCGIEAYLKLKGVFEVKVIEPNDYFYHHIAALRGMVDSEYNHSLYFPYSNLFGPNWIKDRVTKVRDNTVVLSNGASLDFDYLIIATGSSYTTPLIDGLLKGPSYFEQMSKSIEKAHHIRLNGAGPVGIELAGEIKDKYPDKYISMTHNYDYPLSDKFDMRLRLRLLKILNNNNIQFQDQKAELNYDLEINCFGSKPNTGYLADSGFEINNGYIGVNEYLQTTTNSNIYILGDIADLKVSKTFINGKDQVDIIVSNIKASINKQPLKQYKPKKFDLIAIPFGKNQGSGYLPILWGIVLPGFMVSVIKGKDLLRGKFEKWFMA